MAWQAGGVGGFRSGLCGSIFSWLALWRVVMPLKKKKGTIKAPEKKKGNKEDEPKATDPTLKSPMASFRGKPKGMKRPAGRKR